MSLAKRPTFGKHLNVYKVRWSYKPELPDRYDVTIRVNGETSVVTVYLNGKRRAVDAAEAVISKNPGATCVSAKLVRTYENCA